MNADEPLTPEESDALAALRSTPAPPATLPEKTLATLRHEGLVRGRNSRGRLMGLAAAAVLFFTLGFAAASRLPVQPSEITLDQRPYLMLLHQSPAETASEDETRRRVAEYGAWARSLGDSLVDAAKLQTTGYRLDSPSPGDAIQLELASAPDRISGFFLIQAPTIAQAQELAAACPHLKYGGWVELRELDQG